MTERPVLCEIDRGVAVVTLHRPERRNAWTDAMERSYLETLAELDASPLVRAAVVTGQGDWFCPGLDAEALAEVDTAAPVDERTVLDVLSLGLPVVCAVNGGCAGVGLMHALACDVRFVASNAKLSTAFSRRGTVAELATSWLLPKIVGHANALDLLLSGRTVDAAEAARMGLASRVCEPDNLLDEARAYARDVAERCAPRAVAAIKRQVYDDWSRSVAGSEAAFRRLLADPAHAADLAEGAAAFVERRAPEFEPYTGDA